jgi:hypothetical protein
MAKQPHHTSVLRTEYRTALSGSTLSPHNIKTLMAMRDHQADIGDPAGQLGKRPPGPRPGLAIAKTQLFKSDFVMIQEPSSDF